MKKRTAISPRTRFTVLAAGGFRCAYCGKRAPEALLNVDHIVPVAAGGSSDLSNLVAACSTCNNGKSDTPLPAPPAWDPVFAGKPGSGRCPDGGHPGPWEDVPYLGRHLRALVCGSCGSIVATRSLVTP